MTAQPRVPTTLQDFLLWEQTQPDKHEYVDGVIIPLFGDRTVKALAGGTVEHSRLSMTLATLIASAAAPCDTHGSDMLIQTTPTRGRYADVVVTCDERDGEPNTRLIRFPKLIVEVLSESTARDDLGVKMLEYQNLPTLAEYLTIDSRKRWAQISRRNDSGAWSTEEAISGGLLKLQSVDLTIDLDRAYDHARI